MLQPYNEEINSVEYFTKLKNRLFIDNFSFKGMSPQFSEIGCPLFYAPPLPIATTRFFAKNLFKTNFRGFTPRLKLHSLTLNMLAPNILCVASLSPSAEILHKSLANPSLICKASAEFTFKAGYTFFQKYNGKFWFKLFQFLYIKIFFYFWISDVKATNKNTNPFLVKYYLQALPYNLLDNKSPQKKSHNFSTV